MMLLRDFTWNKNVATRSSLMLKQGASFCAFSPRSFMSAAVAESLLNKFKQYKYVCVEAKVS